MAVPSRKHYEAPLGADWAEQVIWYTDDTKTTPRDLTGFTARMKVRRAMGAETALLELTTENGRITLGGAAGTVDIEVASADLEAVRPGRAVFDLEMVDGSGKVTRLLEGSIEFTPQATR